MSRNTSAPLFPTRVGPTAVHRVPRNVGSGPANCGGTCWRRGRWYETGGTRRRIWLRGSMLGDRRRHQLFGGAKISCASIHECRSASGGFTLSTLRTVAAAVPQVQSSSVLRLQHRGGAASSAGAGDRREREDPRAPPSGRCDPSRQPRRIAEGHEPAGRGRVALSSGCRVLVQFKRATGHQHPDFETFRTNCVQALTELGRSEAEVAVALQSVL
jgi:hypothetical protein